jgi:uncharacterized protein (TIGR03118 family)
MCEKVEKSNLVSNVLGLAPNLDPKLINAWGITTNNGNLLVSSTDGHVVQEYDTQGHLIKSINIPFGVEGGSPTGITLNDSKGFVITGPNGSASSEWIVVTEEGGIYGYNVLANTNDAIIKINDSLGGVNYKGVALHNNLLYVANFTFSKVNVYNSNWIRLTALLFIDPTLPVGYSPFNIAIIKEQVYVAYALLGNEGDEQTGPGLGLINVFDLRGVFIKRLISPGGVLNAPWAMVEAPKCFGEYKGKLLVGNFGDGKINVFDFDGTFIGKLKDSNGDDIYIDGLWGLAPKCNRIYAASGPNEEANGLVSVLEIKKCKH